MSLWRFVVCFSLICCMVSGQDTIYKPVGGGVDFPGFSNKESPTDILWKRVEGHNVHKVVHFDGSEEKSFGSFEDRVTLDWRSANLFISNLRYGDSGFYDLEILTNNKHMTKRYKLIVIDKVTKPTISCEINNASTSESAGKATLLCSLPTHSDQSSLEFQWSTNGQINLGHVLKISLGGELDDHQYSCTVKNQLTQESAVFTANDCYSEPKAQAGLIAGVVVGLVVLLLIILLLLFIYHKKVRSKKSDLESHSKPGYLNVAASGSEETRVFLDRAPTCPSSDSEKPYDLTVKQLCEIFEKENGQANEAEPREVVEKEVLENNPSDPEAMNPELTALSSERNDKRPGDEEKRPDILDKDNNPVDADETKDALPGSENNEDEDSKASHPPAVPRKSNIVRNFSQQQKVTENTNPKVIKKQGLDDPADSGNPNEVSNDQSLSEEPEGSGFSSPPAVSHHLDHPCSDDKKPGDEEKRPDILNKENNPEDADETEDALPGSENNEDEDSKASHPPAVPRKSNIVRNFSQQQKVTENTNPKVIKKQGLDDPADSGNPNEVSNGQSLSEEPEDSGFSSPPAVSHHLDHPCSDDKRPGDEEKRPDILDKENNPEDADETEDALPGSENNEDEDSKASHPPAVPKKSNIVRNFSQQQKVTENTNPKVIKKQGLDDPADSGNPNEVSNDQNSGSKKEENEFEKSTPENDVQPPPVARESSPLSQNSLESAPEAECKQDINSDECAKASNGESSSSSSEESENEEQAPPASTAKETDSERTVDEKSLSETASEMETLQNK